MVCLVSSGVGMSTRIDYSLQCTIVLHLLRLEATRLADPGGDKD